MNAIAPGVNLTQRVEQRLATTGGLNALAVKHLLGLVQPREIAEMARLLASDESRWITGQILTVDGGATVI